MPRRTKPIGVGSKQACLAVIVLASCVLVAAQNVVITGSLSGRVTDQTGAVVPGAAVGLRNLATGVNQTAETNRSGLYRFTALSPGCLLYTSDPKNRLLQIGYHREGYWKVDGC